MRESTQVMKSTVTPATSSVTYLGKYLGDNRESFERRKKGSRVIKRNETMRERKFGEKCTSNKASYCNQGLSARRCRHRIRPYVLLAGQTSTDFVRIYRYLSLPALRKNVSDGISRRNVKRISGSRHCKLSFSFQRTFVSLYIYGLSLRGGRTFLPSIFGNLMQ